MAYSTQRAVSDGSLSVLPLSIDYFERSEISVFFDNLPVTSGWAWVGTTDKTIAFSPAVPAGVEVLVRRATMLDRARNVFSLGAQFLARTLDENTTQILRVAQEVREGAGVSDVYNDLNAHGYRLRNLGNATDGGDAITLRQYQADLGGPASSAASAVEAKAALAAANAAAANANAAAGLATGAVNVLKDQLAAPTGAGLVGGVVSLVQLAGTTGSRLIGFLQAGAGAIRRSVEDRLRESVSILDFDGADPTGTTDSSAAILAALNTGKMVNFGGPANTFLVLNTVAYTGMVRITGWGATIKSDILTMVFTNASGSRVRGVRLMPVTVPWTIKRTPLSWSNVLADVKQSLEGYIVNPQDTDLWPLIPQSYKNTSDLCRPGILFNVTSAAGGSDVIVSDISGRAVTIILEGYVDSKVLGCNIGAGGRSYGGILIYNGINRAHNSAFLGFTLPRGTGNVVAHNSVRYAALCGITLFGQDGAIINGNASMFNGESGIKTYQYDGQPGPSETAACISTGCSFTNNVIHSNWYDGMDVSCLNMLSTYAYAGHTISGNSCYRNRHTGITGAGSSNSNYSSNVVNENGTHGLSIAADFCTVTGNSARNNCTTGTSLVAQVFDIVVQGDDNVSYGNNVANPTAVSTYNYLHSGAFGANPTSGREGLDFGNNCSGGTGRISVSPTIPSSRGDLRVAGSLVGGGGLTLRPAFTVTAGAYTVAPTDFAIAFYTVVTHTLTLPNAGTYTGRVLMLKNTNAFAINSAIANVTGPAGGAASSAIIPAIAGKSCTLVSDGTNWQVFGANF